MKLARIFKDSMVLQRRVPIVLWGEATKDETIEVRLNDQVIATEEVKAGEVLLTLPPQEAMEDATLCVGDVVISHVDIGEVWVAGGQSNMEFFLKYEEHGKEEIANAKDAHLRMYTVGRYSFPGDREDGVKAWNPYDEWIPFTAGNRLEELSAPGYYFAKKLREAGVPVGIINCSWGGTTASTWLDKKLLEEDEILHEYIADYEAILQALDLRKYEIVRQATRASRFGKPAEGAPNFNDVIVANTFHPNEVMKMMGSLFGGGAQEGADGKQENPMKALEEVVGGPVTQEDVMAVGPGNENVPGALYENMLSEIIGYSIKGVIWYQGCSDEVHPEDYERLFTTMIMCWRQQWKAKNQHQETLPFIFTQLAPYGMWLMNNGKAFPTLRKQQEQVSKHVKDTYMISITDIGNVFDIHPKNKHDVGDRLARMALTYVYADGDMHREDVIADAPEATELCVNGQTIEVSFAHGQGLHKEDRDFSSYNGFAVETIPEEYIPAIVDGVNGLEVVINDLVVPSEKMSCAIKEDRLQITVADDFIELKGKPVTVKFARTEFYQVNLYNAGQLPVKPFELSV